MNRTLILLTLLVALIGCSGENDSVRASDAQQTLDKVEQELEKAAKDTASRIDDALE